MPNDTNESSTHTEDTATATTSGADTETKTASNESTKSKSDESHQDEGKTFSSDYVKDLRKESANYRNQAKELQRKAEEAEAKAAELKDSLKATQEEAQKALQESKRLNTAFEQRAINDELKAAAMAAGLVDMDVFKMVDTSQVKLTEKGEVVGVSELINNLKKDKPYAFKEITTSNKESGAPKQDASANEKPVYNTPKELADATKRYFESLK